MILSYIRTLVLYLVLIAVIRILGKRQVGQMEPSEFVVTMLIANLASIPMQDGGIALLTGLVPILTVLGTELVLSFFTLRSVALRRLLCGKPVILIDAGKLLQENLRRTRVSLDELTGHLRLAGVLEMEQVQYAILETNGELSVFLYPQEAPATAAQAGIPVPRRYLSITVVQDGRVSPGDLARAGKDRIWLRKELEKRGATLRQTLLLAVDDGGKVTFLKKEERP